MTVPAGSFTLPAGWRWARLKEVVPRIEQGWSPECLNRLAAEQEWGVLKVGCVNGSVFRETEHKALPRTLTPEAALEVRAGDLLISRANTRELVGSAALVDTCRPRLLLCDKLFRVRYDSILVSPAFLVQVLASDLVRAQIERAASGSSNSMLNIGQRAIRDLIIPLPPRGEQERIVTALSAKVNAVGALRAEQLRIRDLLDEIAASEISLSVAPRDGAGGCWHQRKVKRHASKIGSGKTPRGGTEVYVDSGVLFLRSQNVHNDALRVEDVVYITGETDREMAATRVRPGDVLLNITGASIGRTSLVPEGMPAANVNQHVCIIRPTPDIEPGYLAYAMKSLSVRGQIDANQVGSSREGLNFEQVGNLTFWLPESREDQRRVVQYLDQRLSVVRNARAEAERQANLLDQHRRSLILGAVTGRWTVLAREKPVSHRHSSPQPALAACR